MIEVEWEQQDGISIAALAGRIDGSNADEFQHMIEEGIDPENHAVVLDFEQVSYVSSAGLRALLTIAKNINKLGKQFAICALSGQVGPIIKFTGFDQIIPVYDSQAAAINAFENSRVRSLWRYLSLSTPQLSLEK